MPPELAHVLVSRQQCVLDCILRVGGIAKGIGKRFGEREASNATLDRPSLDLCPSQGLQLRCLRAVDYRGRRSHGCDFLLQRLLGHYDKCN